MSWNIVTSSSICYLIFLDWYLDNEFRVNKPHIAKISAKTKKTAQVTYYLAGEQQLREKH